MSHIWEAAHPYYCNDGNYYARGTHVLHETWPEFLSEEGDVDMDYNLVFRWDWKEGEDWGLGDYGGDDYYRHARLHIYFMGQRKGAYRSAEVKVCRADEDSIRAYLEPRFHYLMSMWAPFAAELIGEEP